MSQPRPALEGAIWIIGTGLLGSSLGLALGARAPQIRRRGFDPRAAARALELDALDDCLEGDWLELLAREPPALLVLAAPPPAVRELVEELGRRAPSCPVTDLASTKTSIVRAAERWPDLDFCGAHPMAGAVASGPEAARADLFEGASVALCPPAPSRPGAQASARARALFELLGARCVEVDPQLHDELVALSSHLPHRLAELLSARGAAREALHPIELVRALQGRAWGRSVELAAADPALWKGIYAENRGPLAYELRALAADLVRAAESLELGACDEDEGPA